MAAAKEISVEVEAVAVLSQADISSLKEAVKGKYLSFLPVFDFHLATDSAGE